jgi:PAS domain S-box-containing protein
MRIWRWCDINGLFPTFAIIFFIEYLSLVSAPLHDPSIWFIPAVIYAAFARGWLSGVVSSLLVLAYLIYFYSTSGWTLHYGPDIAIHLTGLSLAFATAVLLARRLKRDFWLKHNPDGIKAQLNEQIAVSGRLETALKASEERANRLIHHLYDEASVCYHELDDKRRITKVNHTECSVLGYTPEEMMGRPVSDFMFELDKSGANGNGDFKGDNSYRTYECSFRRKDGTLVPAVFEEMPIHDSAGEVVGIRTTALDIGERPRAEIPQHESEALFRSAFDSAAVGMALVAPDGRWLRVNRALCEISGYTERELLAMSVRDITFPDDLRIDSSKINQLVEGRISHYQVEKRYYHKKKTPIWTLLSVSLVRSISGDPLYFICQIQDITNRKRIEAELQQSNNLLRAIIEGASDAVYVKDMDSRYLIINKSGAQLFGKPAEEIVGKNDIEFASPESARQKMEFDREVKESGETLSRQLTLTIGKNVRTVQVTKSPYRDHRGNIVGVIGVMHDITDRQRAAENLENSRAQLRALSGRLQAVREEERMRIAREIHDELGQVLTGLKIEITSLAKRLSNPGSNEKPEQLTARTQSITELIDSAIQTVRKISGELRPGLLDAVGLAAAIEWHAKEFINRHGINCVLKIPAKGMILDQERSIAVFRILQEILTNVARHSQATEVTIAVEEQGNDLILKAQDNGRGIRASEFSNPNSLGLLGMRERAYLFGGDVAIRGAQGQGTTVTVRIPLDKKTVDDAPI